MHSISVVIADKNITDEFASQFFLAKSIGLPQGKGLVPITSELGDDIVELARKPNVPYQEFEYLNESIIEFAKDLSSLGMVCYVETEYFGGDGGQSSIVWDKGKVIFGPSSSVRGSPNPINDALRILGVKILRMSDEFDELGLGNNRSTEKWFERGYS
jgi:hypothetical protein